MVSLKVVKIWKYILKVYIEREKHPFCRLFIESILPFDFFPLICVRYSHIKLVEPFVTLAITPEDSKEIHCILFIQAFCIGSFLGFKKMQNGLTW